MNPCDIARNPGFSWAAPIFGQVHRIGPHHPRDVLAKLARVWGLGWAVAFPAQEKLVKFRIILTLSPKNPKPLTPKPSDPGIVRTLPIAFEEHRVGARASTRSQRPKQTLHKLDLWPLHPNSYVDLLKAGI